MTPARTLHRENPPCTEGHAQADESDDRVRYQAARRPRGPDQYKQHTAHPYDRD